MSVYKRTGAAEWSYDFKLNGRRFSGNTGKTSRREAEIYERDTARPKAKQAIASEKAAKCALNGEIFLTLNIACARFWAEKGQYMAAPDTIFTDLERITDHFGANQHMQALRDSDIAAWVARRRGEYRWGRKNAGMVSPSTVNRSCTKRLEALFGHARDAWGVKFKNEPNWRKHMLAEPTPRPREIAADTLSAISADLAPGYRDVMAFAVASGLRLAECFLTWDQVDEFAGLIHVTQKGKKQHSIPISRQMRAILQGCRDIKGHPFDPISVFTYIARGRGGKGGHKIKGMRYPVTYNGMKSAWRYNTKTPKTGGKPVKFHQLRHTRGITLLKASGNLKAVQQILGHASITTTARHYTHVMDEDLRAALDSADSNLGQKSHENNHGNKTKTAKS